MTAKPKNQSKAKIKESEQGKTTIASRFKQKFSAKIDREVNKITTRPEIFQGRTVPFSKPTVEKIVREGFDISQEPIVLFRLTEKKGKQVDIVISGHSRFEAAKKLGLKTIPVKYFKGGFEDAIDYAVIESNRSGNAEGIESDVKAYIRAKARGYNKEFLKSIFKSDSYIENLRLLSYLDANGDFIKQLADVSNKSFPYLERNATWTGSLRFMYKELTNAHEKEIFAYFYKNENKNAIKVKKQSFFDVVRKRVQSPGFESKESLRLNKTSDFDYIAKSDPGLAMYNAQLTMEANLHSDHQRKLQLYVEALRLNETSLAAKLQKEAAEIRELIYKKHAQILKIKSDLKIEDKRLAKGMF